MKIIRPRQVKITSLSVVKIFSTEKKKQTKNPQIVEFLGQINLRYLALLFVT